MKVKWNWTTLKREIDVEGGEKGRETIKFEQRVLEDEERKKCDVYVLVGVLVFVATTNILWMEADGEEKR